VEVVDVVLAEEAAEVATGRDKANRKTASKVRGIGVILELCDQPTALSTDAGKIMLR